MDEALTSHYATKGALHASTSGTTGDICLVDDRARADRRPRHHPQHITVPGEDAVEDGAHGARPTVVLVNGAWANNAAWSGVIERLQTKGYTVDAPPNPLQSLKGDAATIADLLRTIKGPIVLVGHSYGGAVITNAATGNHNVKALVYVDAFAPAKGESVLGLDSTKPGSASGSGPDEGLQFRAVPWCQQGRRRALRQAFGVRAGVRERASGEGGRCSRRHPVARRLQRAHGAVRDARLEDDPELVRARDDRQGDSARRFSCSWLSGFTPTSPESGPGISRWWLLPEWSRR